MSGVVSIPGGQRGIGRREIGKWLDVTDVAIPSGRVQLLGELSRAGAGAMAHGGGRREAAVWEGGRRS